jgi:hypothetical protein
VFLVKVPYMKFGKSKLSTTSFFGKKTDYSILGKNFINIFEILDTWHYVQIHSPERSKNIGNVIITFTWRIKFWLYL